jgi:dienelactone hydrolase
MRRVFLAAAIVFVSLSFAQVARAESVITTDNKSIDINYYPAGSQKAPVVILVPDTRCDRTVFRSLPKQLQKAGFSVVTTDLRYKTFLWQARNPQDAIRLLQTQDLYAPVKYDLKAVIDYVAQKKEIDLERMALVGTSFGSKVAIHGGIEYKPKALVLVSLSGEEALPGKAVRQLLEEYSNGAVLFMTSEKDWGNNSKAAENNRTYMTWGNGKKELKIWPGSNHGVDIVESKEASAFLIEWLKSNL